MSIEFEPWPKIARLNRGIVITEKIDGTNAAVIIDENGNVGAQSRSRLLTPEADNFGFAAWVAAHEEALAETLGEGRHFGEWWGAGIRRRYGVLAKYFSLFNTHRWAGADLSAVPGLLVVPVLYSGPFDEHVIRAQLQGLRRFGSLASPGFWRPEGIVVYHTAARQMFKVTLENDEAPKGIAA